MSWSGHFGKQKAQCDWGGCSDTVVVTGAPVCACAVITAPDRPANHRQTAEVKGKWKMRRTQDAPLYHETVCTKWEIQAIVSL